MGVRTVWCVLLYLVAWASLISQCPYQDSYTPHTRGIQYDIDVTLDSKAKNATGHQILTWTNPSPYTLYEMRFYMYLNGFKNMQSTFLKGSDGRLFGNEIGSRKADEWGWIDITSYKATNHTITDASYIQPNDGNDADQSVWRIKVLEGIAPGEQITLEFDFVAKLPRTIVRAGYGPYDYYLFVHWFPQPGVYEQDVQGHWGWNCHQFFRQTEFYADFADYNVKIQVPDHLVVGGTGCKSTTKDGVKGYTSYHFDAMDVIDFAWVAYPYFETYEATYEGTEIELLISPEHCEMAPRYLQAIKYAFAFLHDNVGPYPYPRITIVDPPMHTLNSGFMEYPMLITAASFVYVPKGIRTIESLAIHEFAHQYFMGILATNEKEHAWMDEGFVAFMEDEIVDTYYGHGSKNSLFDIFGYRSGNQEQSRLEYTTLPNPSCGSIARPSWEFAGDYKALVYAKTATILQTLKAWIGSDRFYQIMRNYYGQHQFTHPRETDWLGCVKAVVGDSIAGMDFNHFFHQTLHDSVYCDYALQVFDQVATISNLGDLALPLRYEIAYIGGRKEQFSVAPMTTNSTPISIPLTPDIVQIVCDPHHYNKLDLNQLNHSWSRPSSYSSSIKYGSKLSSLWHFIVQSTMGWI